MAVSPGEFNSVGSRLRNTSATLGEDHESQIQGFLRYRGDPDRVRQFSRCNSAAPSSGIETVIVSAERRDESVQSVPATLQAFSGQTLADLNVTTLSDLLKYTPSVTYGNNGPGQGEIFVRGLSNGFRGTQSTGTVGLYPNTAIYLDEQSMQFPARNVDIYPIDLQRIEVLEGPQGTLFGGGAEAGALRYITNKPDLTQFSARAEASYGMTEGGDPNTAGNLVFNVPLINGTLALRVAIYDDNQGGYIDNVYSQFTHSDMDPGNLVLGIHPVAGTCPDGVSAVNAYHQGGQIWCTLANAPIGNNANMVRNNQNPVTHQGARARCSTTSTTTGICSFQRACKSSMPRDCPLNIPWAPTSRP